MIERYPNVLIEWIGYLTTTISGENQNAVFLIVGAMVIALAL